LSTQIGFSVFIKLLACGLVYEGQLFDYYYRDALSQEQDNFCIIGFVKHAAH